MSTSSDRYQQSPQIYRFKLCQNQEDFAHISILIYNIRTLQELKQRIIAEYGLTSSRIRLLKYSEPTQRWLSLPDSDQNLEIRYLNIANNDYISYIQLKNRQYAYVNSLSNGHYYPRGTTSIIERKAPVTSTQTLKLFETPNLNAKHYFLDDLLFQTTTIKLIKQKAAEQIQIPYINQKTNLFVYDDKNTKWTKYDHILDDCTLEELDIKNCTAISIKIDKDIADDDGDNGVTAADRHKKVKRELGICGLKNMGSTCYMNSALQCLNSIPQLIKFYETLEDDHADDHPVSDVYSKLIKRMWSESDQSSCITPRQLKAVVDKIAPVFSDHRPKDSHEFINFFLHALQQEQPVLINKLFYGQISSTVTCLDCKSKESRQELISFLPLPIENKTQIQIHYIQYNGKEEQLSLELSVKYRTTVLDLIKCFIHKYVPNLNKNQIKPVRLNEDQISSEYKLTNYLTTLYDNRIALFQLPSIDEEEEHMLCLFVNYSTQCQFRPPVYLIKPKYNCRSSDLREQLNSIIQHLKTTINDENMKYEVSWTTIDRQRQNLNINDNDNQILSTIRAVTISLKQSYVEIYKSKQTKVATIMQSKYLTLEKLLGNFFLEDILDGKYYCSECQQMTQDKQKLDLCRPLPTIFVTQFKRFPYVCIMTNESLL
ncbi:unnamed protein product [Didymodactylos carnosus]|uniref:ubiquitinyl hydrolase 1 n=1 Tax=Didymodactylos carnosus TaxID=1234261 RepID=A0A8S2THY4_9BILA|nr:unnamed protein product [Didymodactylos carnosus]CAF4282888.1 unnamed protein product [Didymodactylos carnosus]